MSGGQNDLSEKPRHGVESNNPAPHPGIDERNSTLAIGLRASLALNGVGQSERARYYAENDARFLTPDSVEGGLENPQSWNLYSYVQNNPVTSTDPDGHDCVVQTRTSDTTENVSVSSGNCNNVNVVSAV